MEKTSTYDWKYSSVGGVVRVNIEKGEDIAHLRELDQKLWTVLSCPVKNLKMDAATLAALDTDNDGKIRVNEVIAAAEWLTSLIIDKDLILKGESTLSLDQINTSAEEGARLRKSAEQILRNLKLEKNEISVADACNSAAIFAGTQFNGDGVITALSTDDDALKALIADCAAKIGSSADRSGETGVNADQIEAFYTACADYAAWQAACTSDVLPYGDNTEPAYQACAALNDKIADYFMRCKLVNFDDKVAGAVDVSADRIGAISNRNLATSVEEISDCPLARPDKACVLPLGAINPAWQAAFDKVKALVLDVDFAGAETLTEADWNGIMAKFGPYLAWKGAKKGEAVESLGLEAVQAVLKADRKADLLALVEQDKALEAESNSIDSVGKLLLLYRDFATLLRNYVIFSDFYGRASGSRALFEAGQLYIDQRCCDLCIKVEDMGAHAAMAGLSGMFLLYCKCTSKTMGASMDIVAVMTDGGVSNLRPGVNAVFYDLDGQDWDAVVTKVVDNPISIKQAFWSPYRKFANTVSDRINKSAAEKENKVSGDMASKANTLSVPTTAEQKAAAADAAKPAPFDIAKFAGIFAAVGLAVGFIGDIVLKLINPWYNVLAIIALAIVCISGPSMFIAWQKLRKRNLGPVLNANGWAINSVVLVGILFGKQLTSIAEFPKVKLPDPYVKKSHTGRNIILAIVIIAAVALASLYFTGNLTF